MSNILAASSRQELSSNKQVEKIYKDVVKKYPDQFASLPLDAALQIGPKFLKKIAHLLENGQITSCSSDEVQKHLAHISHLCSMPFSAKSEEVDIQEEKFITPYYEHIVKELLLKGEGYKFALNYSPFDINIAAVNAYCENINFIMPRCREFHKIDGIPSPVAILKQETDPLLFIHMQYMIRNHHQLTNDMKRKALQEEIIPLQQSIYEEYVQLMMSLSRKFTNKPEKYRDLMADFVARMAFQQQYYQKSSMKPLMLCPTRSMIRFAQQRNNTYVFETSLGERFTVPQLGEDVVYIPGAGYNAMNDIPRLSNAQNTQFILGDTNAFISQALGRLSAYHQANNIHSIREPLGNSYLPNDTVTALVLSLVHNAGKEELQQLITRACSFMKTGGKVLVCNPSNPEKGVGAKELKEMIVHTGCFTQEMDKTFRYASAGESITDKKNFLDINPQEISAFIHRNASSSNKRILTSSLMSFQKK